MTANQTVQQLQKIPCDLNQQMRNPALFNGCATNRVPAARTHSEDATCSRGQDGAVHGVPGQRQFVWLQAVKTVVILDQRQLDGLLSAGETLTLYSMQ